MFDIREPSFAAIAQAPVKLKYGNKKVLMDALTASALTAVYNAVNTDNRAKMDSTALSGSRGSTHASAPTDNGYASREFKPSFLLRRRPRARNPRRLERQALRKLARLRAGAGIRRLQSIARRDAIAQQSHPLGR